jgi:ADP-L-glycero-D-manno-heptose 6-epimerase
MIVVTGAAGFIGSCVATYIMSEYDTEVVIVDDFSREDKENNLVALADATRVDRKDFKGWLDTLTTPIDFIIHLGARTDTTEFDRSIFDDLNLNYSKTVWNYCTTQNVPLIYASSAATYGSGEHGYDDDHSIVNDLVPLNPYGESKNDFDAWALDQAQTPPNWYGLKFFNVYGPNEYHKGRMASVIFHAFKQIEKTGAMKLFRSHNPDFKDGEQLRDFVYVKDVIRVIHFLMEAKPESGLYNLGTGTARTFLDLTRAVFKALDRNEDISFVDTPADIRDKYQYYTQANMAKLHRAGFKGDFTPLETGVEDYVRNYLVTNAYYRA